MWGAGPGCSSAELAVAVRQANPRKGDAARNLANRKLIKTWAMRGSLHLLTPEDFKESGEPPKKQIEAEAARIRSYTGNKLSLTITER